MTERVGQALEQALAYHRAPGMLPAAHGRSLPEGMLTLLRLAAADQALAAQCAESCGESEDEVIAAAVFFVQQVMFANGSDSYRVLGVNPDAPDARIKEHYRWLVRWLHPDRNTDDWDSVYADRVNVAWQTLRLPDRRREYDESRLRESPGVEEFQRRRPAPVHLALPEPSLLSSGTVQRLPFLVLGGLGGIAVLLLLLMWLGVEQRGTRPAPVLTLDPMEAPAALAPPPTDASVAAEDLSASAGPRLAVSAPLPSELLPPLPPLPAAPEPDLAVAMPEPEASMPQPEVLPQAALSDQRPKVPSAPPKPAPAAESPVSPPTRVAQSPPGPVSKPPVVESPPLREATAMAPPRAVPVRTAQPTATQPVGMEEGRAHELLREFGLAYQGGDINALMRLFTADARNNRGGREAIVYDYQSLFSGTSSRELDLTPTGWILRNDGGTLLATYRARVRATGRLRAEVSEGTIRFDLRMVDGRVRISQVRLDDGA